MVAFGRVANFRAAEVETVLSKACNSSICCTLRHLTRHLLTRGLLDVDVMPSNFRRHKGIALSQFQPKTSLSRNGSGHPRDAGLLVHDDL